MNLELMGLAAIMLAALAFLAAMVLQVWRLGWRGAVFGARVRKTVGEVEVSRDLGGKTVFVVHRLEAHPNAPEVVGLEFESSSAMRRRSWAVSLRADQASDLGRLLAEAARGQVK